MSVVLPTGLSVFINYFQASEDLQMSVVFYRRNSINGMITFCRWDSGVTTKLKLLLCVKILFRNSFGFCCRKLEFALLSLEHRIFKGIASDAIISWPCSIITIHLTFLHDSLTLSLLRIYNQAAFPHQYLAL